METTSVYQIRTFLFFFLLIIVGLTNLPTSNIIEASISGGSFVQPEEGDSSGESTFFFLESPEGIATDSGGNIYVADNSRNKIFKFDSTWSLLIEWGSLGSGDGQFSSSIKGVAIDSSDNVYVADSGNNRVQKFNSSGTFLTKWGSSGTGDGQFKTFNGQSIHGIAVDSSNNIFVVDLGNYRVQKFTSTGTYVTKWGSFGSGDGQFVAPTGIGVDSSGNVYVADRNNHRVQKFTSTGTYVTKWGSFGSGDGDFGSPRGLAINDSDEIYVTEYQNNRVQVFSTTGTFITKWGSIGSEKGEFGNPQWVAIDLSDNVLVGGPNGDRVQKFNSSHTFISQMGYRVSEDGFLKSPMGLGQDSYGNIYVSEYGNSKVSKFDSSGNFILSWGSEGSGDGQFDNAPNELAVDSADNIYVVDAENSRIQKFDSSGTFISKWGSYGSGNGEFDYPWGIAIDGSDNIYITDLSNYRVQKFDSNGTYLTQWGSIGSGNGEFDYIPGIAADSSGNVYVSDASNYRIQKFDSNGTYLTQWGSSGTGNGELNYAESVAVGANGNIFVSDSGNNRIQEFDNAGVFIAVHDAGGEMDSPDGVVVDEGGNIYFSDFSNNRIRKIGILHQISNLNAALDIETSGGSNVEAGTLNGLNTSSENLKLSENATGLLLAEVDVSMLGDRDWSTVTGDTNTSTGTAFVHNLTSAAGTAASFTLYVPFVDGHSNVIICPGASSLAALIPGCAGEITKTTSDSDTSIVEIGGQVYWAITGMTGTGGFGSGQESNVVYIDLDAQPATAPSTISTAPEVAVSTADSFYLSYIPSTTEFAASDSVDIAIPFDWSGLAVCAGTGDADGAGGNDHTVAVVDTQIIRYTFTGVTTTALATGVEFCFTATTPATPGNYNIPFSDTNDGDYGPALIYVGDDNDVTLTATIPITLSLRIKEPATTADTNLCALGVLNPGSVNTCSYRIAAGTNISTGLQVFTFADNQLNTAGDAADIDDVAGGATVTAGVEEHGVLVTLGTGWTVGGSFSATTDEVMPLTETLILDAAASVSDSLEANWSTITHSASVNAGTSGGSYDQLVTYRAWVDT